MHEHITHVIDRELNGGKEISHADWDHHSRILDAGAGQGDPGILERIRAARRVADVVVGELITATDKDLAMDVYLGLVMSPYKAKSRPGVNEDDHLKLTAEKIIAKLRQSGWRLFRNSTSYQGHGHGRHMQPYQRCENCDD